MEKTTWRLAGLASILLAVVLLFTAALSLWYGVALYNNDKDKTQSNYQSQIAFRYLETKLRQHDKINTVTVDDVNGVSCLTLHDDDVVCRLYWQDGYLNELYTYAENADDLETGIQILETESVTFAMTGHLVSIRTKDSGISVDLKSGTEVAVS